MQIISVFKSFFTVLGLCIVPAAASLQTVEINEKGEKIIRFDDGTWRFFEENNANDREIAFRYEMQIWQLLGDDTDFQLYQELDKKTGFHLNWLNEIRMQSKELQDELYAAQQPESTYSKEEITHIQDQLSNLKATEKEIRSNILYFEKEKKKLIAKARSKTPAKGSREKPVSTSPQPTVSKQTTAQPVTVSYDPAKDITLNPPPMPCAFGFNGTDEFTGKSRLDTKRDLFFSYTSDELRSYYKGNQDFIRCEGQISRLDNAQYLVLYIDIASKDTQKGFGLLEKNSVLTIRMVDNSLIKLYNTRSSSGIVHTSQGKTTYTAQYLLPDPAIRELRDKPVDKIRVVWSTGYEDYPVYEVDFLMRHLSCIAEGQ